MSEADHIHQLSTGMDAGTVQELLIRLGLRLAQDGRNNEARDALLRAVSERTDGVATAAAYLALAEVQISLRMIREGCTALVDAVVADPVRADEALRRAANILSGTPAGTDTDTNTGTPEVAEIDWQELAHSLAAELVGRGPDLVQLPGLPAQGTILPAAAALQLGQPDVASGFVKQSIACHGPATPVEIQKQLKAGALDSAVTDVALRAFWEAYLLAASGAETDAMTAADNAVRLGSGNRGSDVEGPALELKARLLKSADRTGEAATAWFEAGKRWLWSDRINQALEAFDLARTACQDPELPFYRAECLRIRKTLPGMTNRQRLAAALEAWEEGRSAEHIRPWALMVRASINAELANYDDDAIPRRSAAILDYERASAGELDAAGEFDAVALAYEATDYWDLGCRAVAVWCVFQAWERQPAHAAVIASTARILANAGLRPPPNLVASLRELSGTNPWFLAAAGVLAKENGDLAAANSDLAQATAQSPDNLFWAYYKQYEILVDLEDWSEADALLDRLLDKTDPKADTTDAHQDFWYALALVLKGNPDKALDRREHLLARMPHSDGDVEWLLAAAAAWQGDRVAFSEWAQKGRDHLASSWSQNIRDTAEFLRIAATTLAHRGPPESEMVGVLLQAAESVGATVIERPEVEFGSDAAVRELAALEKTAHPQDAAWVAARLMHARILLAQGVDSSGVDLLSDVLQHEADNATKGLFPEAGKALTAGLAHAAFIAAEHERPDQVAAYLSRSVEVAAQTGEQDTSAAARALVQSPLLGKLSNAGALVALSQGYSALPRLARWSSAERVKIGTARRQIHRRAYVAAFSGLVADGVRDDGTLRKPLAEPAIAVEAHSALFPQMGETPGVKWMLETGIPAMRSRLGQDHVPLPGIRIRPNDYLREGGYRFLVLGEVAAEGAIQADGLFSRDVAAALTHDPHAIPGIGPDGRPGAWYQAGVPPPRTGDGELLGPFDFILEHLEIVLRPRRGALLSRDQFFELLDADAKGSERVAPSRAEKTAALTVARQVLNLGHELPPPEVLLRHVRDQTVSPPDLLAGVAAAVQPSAADGSSVLLDPEIENRLDRRLRMIHGRTAVVLPRDEAAALKVAFQAWHRGMPGDVDQTEAAGWGTLLVRSPQLLLAARALAVQAHRPCRVSLLSTDDDVDV